MVEAKQAVEIALRYIGEFYPGITDFELEEIDLVEDGNKWAITLSMPNTKPDTSSIALALSGKTRKYKIIYINRKDGIVVSMKIRDL